MAEISGQFAPPPMPVRAELRQQTQPAPAPAPVPKEVKAASATHSSSDEALADQNPRIDNTKLTVSLDSDTGTFIYRSVNQADGEVIWQWPTEQVMRVIQYFRRVENMEEKLAAKRQVDQKA